MAKEYEMRCRVDLKSDPISLNIIAADGEAHQFLDNVGDGAFVEVLVKGE